MLSRSEWSLHLSTCKDGMGRGFKYISSGLLRQLSEDTLGFWGLFPLSCVEAMEFSGFYGTMYHHLQAVLGSLHAYSP